MTIVKEMKARVAVVIMKPNKTFRTIRCTPEEDTKLFNAWKRADGVKNCTQYIKAAVNAYAGEQIFDVQETKV